MKYNANARLDTSEVSDTRGSRSKVAVGGGGLGIVGIVIYVVVSLVGGGGSGAVLDQVLGQLGQSGGPATADNSEISSHCKTGADANNSLECAVVADIDSIQSYWTQELPAVGTKYTDVPTVFFSGSVSTGCGSADSGAGPFYCPADHKVYIDLTFYDDLKSQFGANGGPFVNAYVLAHEYGHHVQDLLGVESRVKAGSEGAASASVRLELQADCYAGVWANHASTVPDASGQPLITDISSDDIANALDAASRIGDDYIQTHLGSGHVDPNTFTHGTSAQRQKWFTAGYHGGKPSDCDTFGATSLG